MSRCLVIINPVSGGGAARRYALDLQWKLSTLFDTIEIKFTMKRLTASHKADSKQPLALSLWGPLTICLVLLAFHNGH